MAAKKADTTLEITQNEDLRLRFRYRIDDVLQDFREYEIKSQIREKPGGRLVLDLGPYLAVNPEDATALDLYVPGSVTGTLARNGVWDLFVGGTRLAGGTADVHLSVTT